jgi:hypothetical protein
MNFQAIAVSLLVAILMAWATTPDITDPTIAFDVKATVLTFGLTFMLTFMAFSMLLRRRAKDNDKPTLDAE